MEPKPHGVNPAGVSQIGSAIGSPQHGNPYGAVEKVYDKPGYKAPMAGSDSHNKGSQGRY